MHPWPRVLHAEPSLVLLLRILRYFFFRHSLVSFSTANRWAIKIVALRHAANCQKVADPT